MKQQQGENICNLRIDSGSLSSGMLLRSGFERNVKFFLTEIESSDAKTVMLDLAQINFIDSSGIVLFVKLHKLCKSQDKQFCLCNVGKTIRDLLHVVNLDRVIPIIEK
jgi:anti-anti-sigma factor